MLPVVFASLQTHPPVFIRNPRLGLNSMRFAEFFRNFYWMVSNSRPVWFCSCNLVWIGWRAPAEWWQTPLHQGQISCLLNFHCQTKRNGGRATDRFRKCQLICTTWCHCKGYQQVFQSPAAHAAAICKLTRHVADSLEKGLFYLRLFCQIVLELEKG